MEAQLRSRCRHDTLGHLAGHEKYVGKGIVPKQQIDRTSIKRQVVEQLRFLCASQQDLRALPSDRQRSGTGTWPTAERSSGRSGDTCPPPDGRCSTPSHHERSRSPLHRRWSPRESVSRAPRRNGRYPPLPRRSPSSCPSPCPAHERPFSGERRTVATNVQQRRHAALAAPPTRSYRPHFPDGFQSDGIPLC